MKGNKTVVNSCKYNNKKYVCKDCDYTTYRKWCLDKHNLTRKHIKKVQPYKRTKAQKLQTYKQ